MSPEEGLQGRLPPTAPHLGRCVKEAKPEGAKGGRRGDMLTFTALPQRRLFPFM